MSGLHHQNFEAIAFGFHDVLAVPPCLPDDPDTWVMRSYEDWLESHEVVDGVVGFVGATARLMSREKLLLVTERPGAEVRRFLEESKLDKYFLDRNIVAGEVDGRPPPSPDSYIEALRRAALQKKQERLLVVENSLLDIEAARKAGTTVVGIANRGGVGIQRPNVIVSGYEHLSQMMALGSSGSPLEDNLL